MRCLPRLAPITWRCRDTRSTVSSLRTVSVHWGVQSLGLGRAWTEGNNWPLLLLDKPWYLVSIKNYRFNNTVLVAVQESWCAWVENESSAVDACTKNRDDEMPRWRAGRDWMTDHGLLLARSIMVKISLLMIGTEGCKQAWVACSI